jgi:hypothetical protein
VDNLSRLALNPHRVWICGAVRGYCAISGMFQIRPHRNIALQNELKQSEYLF